jgi:DMSO/TMAO reductase YedYZ molybdopterin-dependent catalytic subunit
MSRLLRIRATRLVDAAIARLESRSRDPAPITRERRDLDRRAFLRVGTLSLAASVVAACNSQGPKSAQRLLTFAEKQNEGVERWLLRHTSMNHGVARVAGASFPSYFVSKHVPVWDTAVRGPWTLAVNGLVQRPVTLTLDQLVALPQTQQRVDHFCVEGWNAVARWWGVRVTELARLVGPMPQARYVDFRSFDDGYHESWDLESAMHPQTLVAYAKDGNFLPPAWGAPARVHSPVKLGYKNTKYLTHIVFMAERNGGYWSDEGYEWYGGT